MFASRRLFCPQLELLPKVYNIDIAVRHCNSVSSSDLGIEIPKRIERGPTDILKALSLTVKRDPTAFHYKFPDDPFFSPYSALKKKLMALSIESGRKSAKWIINKHPELFNHKVAEPFVKAFAPKVVYDEKSDVAEDTLLAVINDRCVTDAIIIYNLLQEKGIECSNDTKQLLLELVSFYNCEDRGNEDSLEFRWYEKIQKSDRIFSNTWKDNGFAEKLFESMKPDCPLACSAIIQGRLKYNQLTKGVELFNFAKDKNMVLSVGVYNELLANANSLICGNEGVWDYMKNILHDMESAKVKPNLYTLNAVLSSLASARNFNYEDVAMATLQEFEKLGIAPSLGSYCYLMNVIFNTKINRETRKRFSLLKNILDTLSSRKLNIRHPSDLLFFHTIMRICDINGEIELAHQLDFLLNKDDNRKFIGDNYTEANYYRSYLQVVFKFEIIERAMEIYKSLVPKIVSVEWPVYEVILHAINENLAFECIPVIWKDLKNLRYFDMFLMSKILDVVSSYKFVEEDETYKVFVEVADTLMEKLTNFNEYENKFQLSSVLTDTLVSNLLITYVKTNNYTKALDVYNLSSESDGLASFNFNAIKMFYEFCLSNKKLPQAVACLKLAAEMGHPRIVEMAQSALPHVPELNSDSDAKWILKLTKQESQK